jgi:hypothetical protein
MALIGVNGGLIGSQRSALIGAASGLWTANEQALLKRAKLWLVASDPNAAAYIAAVEAADGQTLEDGVKAAINSFVVGCKADGIWTAIKASCILAGARTLSGALVPLVGTAPTNTNFVSGDYNRETGLVGNGSTKYLDSNRNNNADPQNSRHLSVWASTASTSTAGQFPAYVSAGGDKDGATGLGRLDSNSSALYSRNANSDFQSITGAGSATAFIGTSRNTSGSYTARHGGSNSTLTQASEANANAKYGVFREVDGSTQGGMDATYSNARLAFYSIGESLNLALLDTRVTTLVNAIAAAIP